MVLKLDMGFIASIMETVSSDTTTEDDFESKMANFAIDMDLASSEMITEAEFESYNELQSLFDYVHISPIKVCIILVV